MVRASSAGVTGLRCGASESPRARGVTGCCCVIDGLLFFAPTPLLIGGKLGQACGVPCVRQLLRATRSLGRLLEYCRVRLLASGAIARRGGRMGMSYLATTETVT